MPDRLSRACAKNSCSANEGHKSTKCSCWGKELATCLRGQTLERQPLLKQASTLDVRIVHILIVQVNSGGKGASIKGMHIHYEVEIPINSVFCKKENGFIPQKHNYLICRESPDGTKCSGWHKEVARCLPEKRTVQLILKVASNVDVWNDEIIVFR